MTPETLVIFGGSERLWKLAGQLREGGVPLTFFSESAALAGLGSGDGPVPALVLMEATSLQDLDATEAWTRPLPWLALCVPLARPGESELMVRAYELGARAALPADSPDAVVVRSVLGALASVGGSEASPSEGAPQAKPRLRHHPVGAGIPLHPGELLRVISGVVAQIAWHHDGTEGLIGLWGPGHLLPGHPEDSCRLALKAQTEVALEIHPLPEPDPVFDGLLDRSRLLEAWSAMQSRPSMEQRLIGVLELLAEQFGQPSAEGTLIDLRITHAQLAAAIGATRATVTRLLGPLRRRGVVSSVATPRGERMLLPNRQSGLSQEIDRPHRLDASQEGSAEAELSCATPPGLPALR